MKIKKRNLLTVFLALLCTVALALGVSFAMPKNNIKTASASTSLPFSNSELEALAAAAKYSDFSAMSYDLYYNDASVNASTFGSYTVSLGGYEWFPVLANASEEKINLTLWLKNGVGPYPFSDGTYSSSTAVLTQPNNDYRYSWIRSAINAGQTSDNGVYYGNYSGTTPPTRYENHEQSISPRAICAPVAFNAFMGFVEGGDYAKHVVAGGDYGDNLWLPSLQEVQGGGLWGCTSVHWASVGSYCWTSTACPTSAYNAYLLAEDGSSSVHLSVDNSFGVRPAITITISRVTADTPEDVSVVYNNNPQSIADVAAADKEWYDSSIMTLTQLTTPMTDVGTYTVKVELTSQAAANGIFKFDGTPDASKGNGDESDTVRYFDFKITPKPIKVPSVLNSTTTYKFDVCEFALSDFDATIMSVVQTKLTSNVTNANVIWNSTNEKFEATEAATYTVFFHMDSANYMWDVGNGTTADQSKTITINKKEISITTTPAANTSPSWGLGETANIAVTASSGITAAGYVPDFVLNMYYIKDGDTANPLTTGIDSSAMTLDVSQIESSGEYKLCIELTSATAN
ncbi:MAG: hypothetical protein K2H30_04515, partial [Clostridia bacterium]|nr:hypothetical protein [Clostridia bacterium]